jgi:type IV secretion system protein TrbI
VQVPENRAEKSMPQNNDQANSMDAGTQLRATVEDKAPKPAGLLPKNTQQLVILGVAVVMVLIMWLTGGTKHASTSPAASSLPARIQPPNPATVEDFKETIQQQQAATRQPISPTNLARLRAMGLANDAPGGAVAPPEDVGVPQPGGIIGGTPSQQAPPPSDPVKEDQKKREYLSLFANNVAFTYRKSQEGEQPTALGPTIVDPMSPQAEGPRQDHAEAQLNEGEVRLPEMSQPVVGSSPSASSARLQPTKPESEPPNPDASRPGSFNSFNGNRYVVFEGTVLETILVNRLNGTFAGPVNCLVTSNIYSHDHQRILIPAGSRVLGEAKKVEELGQQRLAISFHRLVMPDGYSVTLDQFKGLDQIGETAIRDKVNNHYLQIFGASLAIGVLGGIAQAGTGSVFTNSALDQARAGFGASLANSSIQILDRFLNILPTVTIREGSRVKVYLSGDLLLPDYAQHTVEPSL